MPTDAESLSSRLRYRVTLVAEASPADQNRMGEPIESRFVEATLWADVRTLSGRELVNAMQVAATASSVVEIRWRPGVDRFKSVQFEGRTLNIDAAVDPDSRRIRLLLYCQEQR